MTLVAQYSGLQSLVTVRLVLYHFGVVRPASPLPMGIAKTSLLEDIRTSVIGGSLSVEGPFGPVPVVYADYTASGRALSFIEN